MRILGRSDRGAVVRDTPIPFREALNVLAERTNHTDYLMSRDKLSSASLTQSRFGSGFQDLAHGIQGRTGNLEINSPSWI